MFALRECVGRRSFLRFFGAASAAGLGPCLLRASETGSSCADHIAWVDETMKEMLKIVPGMTRLQLLDVFTVEGGISTGSQRAFVSRECGYFKVHVTFRRSIQRGADALPRDVTNEYEDDEIVTISVPFLQYEVFD